MFKYTFIWKSIHPKKLKMHTLKRSEYSLLPPNKQILKKRFVFYQKSYINFCKYLEIVLSRPQDAEDQWMPDPGALLIRSQVSYICDIIYTLIHFVSLNK